MTDIQRDYEWLAFFQALADIARDHGFDDIAEAAEFEAAEFEDFIIKQEMNEDGKE